MSVDLTITTDSELMVAHIEAQTDDATEFVDAYLPAGNPDRMTVVDSGRIVLDTGGAIAFVAEAKQRGLTIEKVATR